MHANVDIQKRGHRFIAVDGGSQVGEIDYRAVDEKTWAIERADVDADYRDGNLAVELLDTVVQEARARGFKIIPSCEFAMEQFQNNPAYNDVWRKNPNFEN